MLFPSESLDDEGVSASLLNESTEELKFTWHAVLFDHNKISSLMVPSCRYLDVGNATLLAQGMMEFIEQFQTKE